MSGSSPRVRGKGRRRIRKPDRLRIIPAGAGKSQHRYLERKSLWDHPRGCGEKSPRAKPLARLRGSSPRVRGKAAQGPPRRGPQGIIPAGAGKRRGPCPPRRGRRDHPRGCGEKSQKPPPRTASRGSSPRVRGKGERPRRRRGLRQDHPRGCGEKRRSVSRSPRRRGSSPRVRGKALILVLFRPMLGIIPAGAGKSRF